MAWLKEHTDRGDYPKRVVDALATAIDADGLATALRPVVDERGSPGGAVLAAGAPMLQPTDEQHVFCRLWEQHMPEGALPAFCVRQVLSHAFRLIAGYTAIWSG